jgi:antitoxin component YwqK of YwqJK toxin-antitoxin module
LTTWLAGFRTDERYEDGVLHGWQLEWNRRGELRSATHYEHGKKQGPHRRVYNTWIEDCSHLDDVKHGVWTARRKDGGILLVKTFNRGVLDGEWHRWHANGQQRISGAYRCGARHGHWIWWDESGAKIREGAFREGVPDGTHRVWDVSGKQVDEQEFREGTGRWARWYPHGAKRLEGQYVAGKMHGCWRRWGPGGELLGEFSMRHGTGVEVEWDDDGRMRRRTSHRDGVPHGLDEEWNTDGELVWQFELSKGELVATAEFDAGTLIQRNEWCGDQIVKTINFKEQEPVDVWERVAGGDSYVEYSQGLVETRRETRAGYEASYDYDFGELGKCWHRWGRTCARFELRDGRIHRAFIQQGFDLSSHRELEFEVRAGAAHGHEVLAPIRLSWCDREGDGSDEDLHVDWALEFDPSLRLAEEAPLTDREISRLHFSVHELVARLAERGIRLETRGD